MIDLGNHLYCGRELWQFGIQFLFAQRTSDDCYLAAPIVMKKAERGQLNGPPTFTLSDEETQGLFNQLWQLGFRPKDGTGNSGHVEALKYHLEDMRKLVFK